MQVFDHLVVRAGVMTEQPVQKVRLKVAAITCAQ